MKTVKLKTLKIRNFKGIKEFTFKPRGESVEVYGENGTGKTSLMDAYSWLLFGTDSKGQSQFDVKPRDENGLNLGEKEPSYSLDWLSKKHLDMQKLEYNEEGLSLDAFYEKDPVNYLKYNIIDVILTVRLNDKLKHIDLYNMIRRDMNTPLSMSLRGPSALFDSLFMYEIDKLGKTTRYGIVNENIISINDYFSLIRMN